MTLTTLQNRVRSTIIKTGAVAAVAALVSLSALGNASAASADDAPTIEIVAPTEIVEPVEAPIDDAPVDDAPVDDAPIDDADEAPTEPVDAPTEPVDVPADLILDPAAAAAATPFANDDKFGGADGSVKDILPSTLYLNDTDPTSTTLELDDPLGQVTLSGGYISVLLPAGVLTDRVFYYRTSGVNGTSNWATVTIVIASGNLQPLAYADSYVTPIGTPLVVPASGLLANDKALGGYVNDDTDQTGEVITNVDGSFTYVPAAGFIGTKVFHYQILASGVPSNWGQVNITVGGAAPAVLVANADVYQTVQDVDLDVPANGVLANDSSLTSTVFVTDDASGETVVMGDGALHYSPPAGFTGTKTFAYRSTQNGQLSNWATVTIEVTAAPPVAPVAVDDKYSMDMDTTLKVAAPGVLANDSSGIVWWHGGFYSGALTLQSDGNFVYTPDAGFTGTTVISYTIRDNFITSNVATITIEVVDPEVPTLTLDDPAPVVDVLAFTGVDSTGLALPALAIFLLGALALGYSAARRRAGNL